MKKLMILWTILGFGAMNMAHAKSNLLPLLSCDFAPKSRMLVFLQAHDDTTTHIYIQRMQQDSSQNWQIKRKLALPLSQSYLNHNTVNGTVWAVPHGRHWYVFNDLTSSKDTRSIFIEIRSRKTGKMVEFLNCAKPDQSLLRILNSKSAPLERESTPLMTPKLIEWFYKISQ